MFPPITYRIVERGPTPRGMASAYRAAAKQAWQETGIEFASEHADRRFTHKHAREAGYQPRTQAYERRKLKKFGHTYPLEYSGQTRQRIRIARVSSTSKGNRVSFPQARRLNTINRGAERPINMLAEFVTVPQGEADELASYFDSQLDLQLQTINTTPTETIIR